MRSGAGQRQVRTNVTPAGARPSSTKHAIVTVTSYTPELGRQAGAPAVEHVAWRSVATACSGLGRSDRSETSVSCT
jgi:hypothetical protein